MLQWVHGPRTVVMLPGEPPAAEGLVLQWVHGPRTVVMLASPCPTAAPTPASMGPRSENRGYAGSSNSSPHFLDFNRNIPYILTCAGKRFAPVLPGERIMARKAKKGLSQAAKTLGAAGASSGGKARARVLTRAQRKEIARKGAIASNRKQGKGK